MPRCEEVIISNEAREGSGKDVGSPIRVVVEVYSKDGSLIAKNDPQGQYTIEDLVSFSKFMDSTQPPINAVTNWLKQR